MSNKVCAQHCSYMDPCVPLPLEDKVLNDVLEKAGDWALMHGISTRSKSAFTKDAVQFAPFLLVPSTFPQPEFDKAMKVQIVVNELIHNVAHDFEFLKDSLKTTIAVDDFTRRLFEIYEFVRSEGIDQTVSLGLLRSDYILSCPSGKIKQVEVNTIASSFAALSNVVYGLHSYTLTELGFRDRLEKLPPNNALDGLIQGMLEAWKIYGNSEAVILFLVEDVTYNICDQRAMEFRVRELMPGTRVIRRTLTEVGKRGTLSKDKALTVDGYEVALCYFRSGYMPDQYVSEVEWTARLTVERSRAIKCPSIHYHLAGTKKVQQELSKPGILERFLKDPEKVVEIRNVFAGLYSLDFTPVGESALADAIANPSCYVLKPQREGGGNNLYDEDLRQALLGMKESKERAGWILMDRLYPPLQKNYLARPGSVTTLEDVVGELGIYGVVIGDEKKIFRNEHSGYLLRSKLSSANEGGVVAGAGALDSVCLVDVKQHCNAVVCDR